MNYVTSLKKMKNTVELQSDETNLTKNKSDLIWNQLDSNEFLRICRYLMELLTKRFINENFIAMFLNHHIKVEQMQNLNIYNKRIGDFEKMINVLTEELNVFRLRGTEKDSNLKKYEKHREEFNAILHIYIPYYNLQKVLLIKG